MRILLTNDDGITAPGILALHDAITEPLDHPSLRNPAGAHPLGGPGSECLVVAPRTVQSATGHGITPHEPLMVSEENLPFPKDLPGQRSQRTGFAVDGRPADCVKLAVSQLWPQRMGGKPDLLISGMNAGANCGINVIYSGTVAAAIEGAFLGIPSIAVSLRLARGKPDFAAAARHARVVLERILAAGCPAPGEVLSINIPAVELGSPQATGPLPPVRVCPMNVHGLVDKYERRTSPTGEVYYWAAGHGLDFHATEPGSDVDLLLQGTITVTPLHFDLTKHERLGAWRSVEG